MKKTLFLCTMLFSVLIFGQEKSGAKQFWENLQKQCGKSFEGEVKEGAANDTFRDKKLVMHVRNCDENTIRIPFFVGDDKSRTWVFTYKNDRIQLKHDHRHEDGSEDVQTQYGGDTATAGTAQRQEFPVDAESIALFGRTGSNASVTNTWAMEVQPGQRFLYELSRPGGRLFQVEFDLSQPVALPPAPWGATD